VLNITNMLYFELLPNLRRRKKWRERQKIKIKMISTQKYNQ
jgi:hypothetical protein